MDNKVDITKTRFLSYLRCPKFFQMERLRKHLNSRYDSMEVEEENYNALKMMEDIIDSESYVIDRTHLNAMLKYYNDTEEIGMKENLKLFPNGTMISDRDTFKQKHIEVNMSQDIYIHCFLDGFWVENGKPHWKIFEAKATTSRKFLDLKITTKRANRRAGIDAEHVYVFEKDVDGTYSLTQEFKDLKNDEKHSDKYHNTMNKFRNKFGDIGKYLYDIAFQKHAIEIDKYNKNMTDTKVEYYLTVLNKDYIKGVNDTTEPLTVSINVTEILNDRLLMNHVQSDLAKVTRYMNTDTDHTDAQGKLTEACGKGQRKCEYYNACFNVNNQGTGKEGSILDYMGKHNGFKNAHGDKIDVIQYFNEGKTDMLDIPEEFMNRPANAIQRQRYQDGTQHINSEKIRKGLELLEYPLIHLDFESFNAPIPRFKGEKPYDQSVFQYSIHIEDTEGVCDKDEDHYEFLSTDNTKDERLQLVESMLNHIPEDHGSVIVWNKSFEESRIKEFIELFPQHKDRLEKLNEKMFDLMWLVKGNEKLYKSLGFDKDEAKELNFYDPRQKGSYSIKYVLPVLSDLDYKGMLVSNGVEALVTYANLHNVVPEKREETIQAMIDYCKQDTWAMVVVLAGIRDKVEEGETIEFYEEAFT